jgi:hypothetical protein
MVNKFIFFNILGFLFLLSFFFIKIAYSSEVFEYMINKNDLFKIPSTMLLRSVRYSESLSLPIYKSNIFVLQVIQSKFIKQKFVFTKLMISKHENFIFIQEIEKFLRIDIWNKLENSNDRSTTVEKYIQEGEFLSSRVNEKVRSLSNQENFLKTDIKKHNNNRKIIFKKYVNLLGGWDPRELNNLKKELIEIDNIITRKNLDYQSVKIYLKRLRNSIDNLNKKVLGAKDNKDALIKNVKVKKSSGQYINVIE